MISKIAKFSALLATVALLVTPSAFAKKKPVDLSVFAGKYSGTGTLNATGTIYTITATLNFKAAQNGKSAVVTVTGSMTGGGTTYPINNTFTFAKSGTMAIADFLFGATGAAVGSTGTYVARKNRITYSSVITASPTATVTGAITTNPKAKKQTLTLTADTAVGGVSLYPFTFNFKKNGKKK